MLNQRPPLQKLEQSLLACCKYDQIHEVGGLPQYAVGKIFEKYLWTLQEESNRLVDRYEKGNINIRYAI